MQAVCGAIIAHIAHHRIFRRIGIKTLEVRTLVDITAVIHDAEKIRLKFSHGFCAMFGCDKKIEPLITADAMI